MLQPDVVVVGGAGHIGLPLSLRLAEAGMTVGILDVSEVALEAVAAGRMPFLEDGAQDLLDSLLPTGRLVLTSSPDVVAGVPTIIVVIGTPLDEFMNPSMAPFERVMDELAPHIGDDVLLILRSTVAPGTTPHIQRSLAARGLDVGVAFCPERTIEGQAVREMTSFPQIVGADDPRSAERAASLFEAMGARTVPATTAEAEFAKLFTNAWRYIKFATANEFFTIANGAGQDYGRILKVIRDEYPRAADLPGPGFAAGPCLLKDTMQLAASTAQPFSLGRAAREVNEGLPDYVAAAIERRWGDLSGKVVGILGMAFKAESDDIRSSLSYRLRKVLIRAGAKVVCSDPFVDDDRLISLEQAIERSEILIIGVPHERYRDLEAGDTPIVDIWGATPGGIRL